MSELIDIAASAKQSEAKKIDIIKNDKLVCPFRSLTIVTQGVVAPMQEIQFPECQYVSCPFYISKAKENTERCLRAMAEVNRMAVK